MFSTNRKITAAGLAGVGIMTAISVVVWGDTSDLRYVWADKDIVVLPRALQDWRPHPCSEKAAYLAGPWRFWAQS